VKKRRSYKFLYFPLLLLLATALTALFMMVSHGFAPSEEALETMPHRLQVLTWNTGRMGGFAKPQQNEVLRYLLEQDADIICLQEVDVYKEARYLTLNDVKKALSAKYRYSYLDFSVYNKRHQFGTMVWSKYPLIHKQSIRYETIGNLSNRCDVVVGKDTIRLINNHLESYNFTPDDLAQMENQRNYEGMRSSLKRLEQKWERALPLRNEQARMIRKEIEASPYPVIVAGDFNSIPLSYAYWHISRGLNDAFEDTSWFRWGATCEKRGFGLRIDYLLSGPSIVPFECEVKKEADGSDHHPLVASFAW
jgi:endonuclease/exonuclease/phosphatase family metal-dependent hydrolase